MRSKYEIRLQKELEAKGCTVDNKAGMSRWAKNRDFFNLFDLCYLNPDRKTLHWASVKGKAGIPNVHLQEIKAFVLPPNNVKEIWARTTSKKREKYWHKIII